MLKAPPSRPAPAAPARSGSRRPNIPGTPRIRRGYFECRYGQLHVHNAIPSGGGFEEGTPLVCLHASPLSGRVFTRFLAVAGIGRSVFAPDLPGFGDSDPPPSQAGVAELAAAIGDFLDTLRLRRIDLLGHRFGALVATELAAARPAQVRRLMLVSPFPTGDPGPPRPAAADGNSLLEEWRRTAAYCGAGAPPEVVSATLAERLRNGVAAAAAVAAERGYPLSSRLSQLAAPILVLRLRDDLAANGAPVRNVPARARLVELPEHGASLFETAPETTVRALDAFLR